MIALEAGKPWPAITKALRTAGPRHVAIAYVATDADRLLPLKPGDVLVTNLGPAALKSRATNPAVVRTFHERGVNVYSWNRLHAKVAATTRLAVIGSANASNNSAQNVDEAVIITDDPTTISAVRAFVTGLTEAIPVTDEFLDDAQRQWDAGRASGVPGQAGTAIDHQPYIPTTGRMFVQKTTWDNATQGTQQAYDSERRKHRNARGPASVYALESLTLYPDDDDTRPADIYIEVFRDKGKLWIYPPAVVINQPLPIPRSRGKRMVLLRRRTDLEPIPLGMATASLRAARVPIGDPFSEHQVKNKRHRQALLDLWALEDGA
jgi:hypothetical protein